MTGDLPRQTRRCTRYAWCGGHVRGSDADHSAAPVTVAAQDGRSLRLTLVAYDDEPPLVEVEVVLTPGGLPMPVASLDPADVLLAASALRRIAIASQERVGQ